MTLTETERYAIATRINNLEGDLHYTTIKKEIVQIQTQRYDMLRIGEDYYVVDKNKNSQNSQNTSGKYIAYLFNVTKNRIEEETQLNVEIRYFRGHADKSRTSRQEPKKDIRFYIYPMPPDKNEVVWVLAARSFLESTGVKAVTFGEAELSSAELDPQKNIVIKKLLEKLTPLYADNQIPELLTALDNLVRKKNERDKHIVILILLAYGIQETEIEIKPEIYNMLIELAARDLLTEKIIYTLINYSDNLIVKSIVKSLVEKLKNKHEAQDNLSAILNEFEVVGELCKLAQKTISTDNISRDITSPPTINDIARFVLDYVENPPLNKEQALENIFNMLENHITFLNISSLSVSISGIPTILPKPETETSSEDKLEDVNIQLNQVKLMLCYCEASIKLGSGMLTKCQTINRRCEKSLAKTIKEIGETRYEQLDNQFSNFIGIVEAQQKRLQKKTFLETIIGTKEKANDLRNAVEQLKQSKDNIIAEFQTKHSQSFIGGKAFYQALQKSQISIKRKGKSEKITVQEILGRKRGIKPFVDWWSSKPKTPATSLTNVEAWIKKNSAVPTNVM